MGSVDIIDSRVLTVALISAIYIVSTVFTTTATAGRLEDSLLAGAAARLDTNGVEIAIRRGAKVNEALPSPYTDTVFKTPVQLTLSALTIIEEKDNGKRAERILRTLFKAGAKLTGDKDELFSAISGGHERIVKLLLEKGANPHALIYGYTPAELSVKYGHPKLMKIFYARGVPRVDTGTIAQIQFVQAAGMQDLAEMKAALAKGAEVNSPDSAGNVAIVQIFDIPLYVRYSYDAVMWLLLESGADANAKEFSDDKSTALHNVIKRNSYKSVDRFISAEIVELLLRKGADVSAVDSLGRTPLHYAAQYGNTIAMGILIRNGAKIMARDALRKTPLDFAESGDAISMLREAGARE